MAEDTAADVPNAAAGATDYEMTMFLASLVAQQGIHLATETSNEGILHGALASKYKTEPCKFYSMGKCQKGDACTYAHVDEGLAPALPPQDLEPPAPLAKSGKEEWARSTESQIKALKAGKGGGHLFKSIPCKYFLKGKCTKGEDCTFAHSDTDLRSERAAKTSGNMPGSSKASFDAALKAVQK